MRLTTSVVALIAVISASANAQVDRSPAYVSVTAGVALQPIEFNVRSTVGRALAAAVGRQLSVHRAVELRVGGASFGAPPEFISPGGCFPPGRTDCPIASPSPVHVITMSGDYRVSGRTDVPGLFAIVGAGVRHITESPQHASEVRPLVEVGAGMTVPFSRMSVGLEMRFQRAAASSDLPRWTAPMGLTLSFF